MTKNSNFTITVKNVETAVPECLGILPEFLTNQNFWRWCWTACTPSSHTTEFIRRRLLG